VKEDINLFKFSTLVEKSSNFDENCLFFNNSWEVIPISTCSEMDKASFNKYL